MIKEYASETVFVDDEDMQETVRKIISSLADDIKGYELAFQTYDSVFFDGETPAFKAALCKALLTKYPNQQNEYWKSLASAQPVESIHSEFSTVSKKKHEHKWHILSPSKQECKTCGEQREWNKEKKKWETVKKSGGGI